MEHDYIYKFIILGDNNCGKTSLLNQYIDTMNDSGEYQPTIGVDFKVKTVESNGKKIKLNIWDTAGQEIYKAIISYYYKNIAAAIIVFDLTNYASFKNVNYWIDEIGLNGNHHERIPIILIGNKSDVTAKREVCFSEANLFAKEYNLEYFETNIYEWETINSAVLKLVEKTTEYYIDKNIISAGIKDLSLLRKEDDLEKKTLDCCKVS
tara:strand:- start:103 stop:726 length:624 start_codon:yes stop_codon:yes gene_type:complete